MTLKGTFWVLSALILSLGTNIFAQQPERPSSQAETTVEQQRATRHGRKRRERHLRRAEMLGLSDTQRQQLRAIHEQRFAALKEEREELNRLREKRRSGAFTEADAARAKQLREQMREARKNIRGEVEGILTTEQRARIDEAKKARRQQREEIRQRRRESRETNP